MIKQRKATEKPIEIFVALFVILAVALVMLKLFNNQLSQKQGELENFQQEQKSKELLDKAKLHCNSKCNDASNDQCSLKSLASFCIAYGSDKIKPPDWLDLNLNGVPDTDNTLLAGIETCEDAVPCHALVSSCCGRPLNAQACKSILETYWTQQGYSSCTDMNQLVAATVKTGSCPVTPNHWYEKAGFNSMTCTP